MTQFYSGMKGPVAIEKLNELWTAADTIITGAIDTAADVLAAEAAAAAASTQATNAQGSATAASTQATNASTSASTASTQATNAQSSATAAAGSATAAAGSAAAANTQATNASTSASAASTQATNAQNSATAAAGSATTANTQATNASTSASAASTQATNASGSASTASTQATNAANSASAANTQAINAANLYDSFDDRYLGIKSSQPSVDNDGNTLLTGALYFNTTDNNMYVYTATGTWVTVNNLASSTAAAVSASQAESSNVSALAYKNTAQDWAEKATEVEAGKYSAKYWAGQAASSMTGGVTYRGTWQAASASYPPLPSTGDYFKVSVAGTVSSVAYSVNDSIIYNGSSWDKIDNTDAIVSVAGKVGEVVLVKADVGLSNVDNTSDMNKPVSTAVSAALAAMNPIVYAIALG